MSEKGYPRPVFRVDQKKVNQHKYGMSQFRIRMRQQYSAAQKLVVRRNSQV